MVKEPSLGDAGSSSKLSSFTRWVVALIATAMITVPTQFWINWALQTWTTEKKALLLTTVSSQNLATAPEGLANTLEFRLVLSPTDKRQIRSIFAYEVAIQNESKDSLENVTLHLYPPADIKLIDPPKIITSGDLRSLADGVLRTKRVLENEIVFDVELLGPGERVALAYSGYSEEADVDQSYIKVEARKKGWVTRSLIPGFSATYDPSTGQTTKSYGAGYTDYRANDFEPYAPSHGVLSKPITEYKGSDVIALLLVVVTLFLVSGLFASLLWYMLLALSKSDLRSLVQRLFRRAV
ncbi:hypothetical protein [Bradyrhizobium yuanmingense]|uniref:hypothetical protein n=1 Tax=Bradyrhizobium yuanmingense TaxID=108015 RepID=UPI001CD46D22|nr:hypothetical protein [Bradyrhizobium yuanmingense]MCA1524325.1 hypothetical protein [Bradyrhizobium yuanmingense]